MKNNPKISVIVPIYNAEKYIDRCMSSIYAQTFKDYEIILVNDGSTDGSDELCRKYQEQDDQITYIKKENEGAGSARNKGIEVAKGDYLAFPDVDDWFEPNMYEELYRLAKSGDFDIVFSGINYYTNSKDSGRLKYNRSANCESHAYHSLDECHDNVMDFFPTSIIFDSPCNKLYKRTVIIDNKVRFSDTRRCQDAMFNLDFYNYVNSAISIDKAYYNYIENNTESVNRKFPINYIDINVVYFDKLFKSLTAWGTYQGKVKQHYDTSFVIAVYGTLGMFENPYWDLDNKQQKEYIKNILTRDDIHRMLIGLDIRKDALRMYKILINRDYVWFVKNYMQEKVKDRIRRNTFIMSIYRFFRK